MKWQDQNTIGIAWSQILESIGNMWSVYHNMEGGPNKEKMYQTIIDITEKFSKMSGIIGYD